MLTPTSLAFLRGWRLIGPSGWPSAERPQSGRESGPPRSEERGRFEVGSWKQPYAGDHRLELSIDE